MKQHYLFTLILSILFGFVVKLNATVYFSKATGDLDALASWGTNADGSGTNPSVFTLAGDVFKIRNRATVTHSGSYFWLLSGSTTVQLGDSINSINFLFQPGDFIFDGIWNISPNATFSFNEDPAVFFGTFNIVDVNSTVRYNFSGATILIPVGAQYGNIEIQASATIPSSSTSLLTRTINISSGQVFSVTANNTITISESILGTGNINSPSGNIIISTSSTGNRGSLNVTGSVLNFSITSPPTGFLTLGSDLNVTGSFFAFSTSGIDLNGRSLTLSGNITFPTFAINSLRGSSNSAIFINGSGTITNSLRLNTSNNSLKVLSLNRSSVSLTLGNAINVTDSISVLAGTLNTGGFLTLKATSSLKGRVGRVGGTIAGNVGVETFIPGSVTGWTNLGINGVSGQTIGNWDGQIPMTCNGCTNPTTAISGGFGSITEWDEVAGDYVTGSNTTALTPGKGFWVYVGSGLTTTTDFTLLNTGSLVQGSGSIPVTLTATNGVNSGFNLVANPYASPISWTKLRALGTNSNIVTNAIYVWNADLAGGVGATTSYIAGAASPGGGAIGDAIPAGQGFYVEATAAGNITYDESIKSNQNTGSNPLLRTSETNNYGNIFRLKLTGVNDWDATVFRIHKDATALYDKNWDAHKIFQSPGYVGFPGVYNNYTTISSKDALNENYSIHSIPSLSENISIPVLVRVSASGTYTIDALELDNVSDCVLLNDNLLHTTTNLKESNYIFSIDDTTSTPRFDLILCKSFATPVSVADLTYASLITINQDQQGAFVKTAFEQNTKATISVFNIMGQKLTEDIQVEGTVTSTHLNINLHNQVVFIKVVSEKESVTKKMVIH